MVQKTISGNIPSTAETYGFILKASGSAPLPAGLSASQKTVTITGAGEANFGNITFYTAGTYTYDITEVKGSASRCDYDSAVYTMTVVIEEESGELALKSVTYTKLGSAVTSDKAAFNNHYRSGGSGPSYPDPDPVDKVSINVRKIWAGDQNPEQPQSVIVQLFKDGKPYGNNITLSKENNWRYGWTGLEKGPAWTVDETVVPAGYKKTVTGNASSGFLITNTWFKPTDIPSEEIEKVTVRGQKTWNHGNNPIGNRPQGIVIYIKDGSQIAASAMITNIDHWQWCFTLPKFRADGSVANYTVDEDQPANYTKEINGYDLINTYKSDTSTKPGPDGPGKGSPNDKSAPGGQKSPRTDDSSNLLIWLILLLIDSCALIITVCVSRRGSRR
jgi:pilin isopeptide linkage protein